MCLHLGASGKADGVGHRLTNQLNDRRGPLRPVDQAHVVVSCALPLVECLLLARTAVVALLGLRQGYDLVLVAVHDQGRARHRSELAKRVERLRQHIKHLRALCPEELWRHHCHHRQLLHRHQTRVDDQAVNLRRPARRQVHGACRSDRPPHDDALGVRAARRLEERHACGEARLRVPAKLREARLPCAPGVATIIDGEERGVSAVEYVDHVVHRSANLRVAMEEVHHGLHLTLRNVEPVAHGVAAGDLEGAVADGAGGGAQMLRRGGGGVEGDRRHHGVFPQAGPEHAQHGRGVVAAALAFTLAAKHPHQEAGVHCARKNRGTGCASLRSLLRLA
mmetsp:Transcript_70885/g.196951  ORF Transcript_70885/g.196951 Transcript_70885/m.196951 type:complete len:336 (+) Transcript_70885:407-1414(+)